MGADVIGILSDNTEGTNVIGIVIKNTYVLRKNHFEACYWVEI